MFCAGVDIGSRTVKVAIIELDSKNMIASGITDTGPAPSRTATDLFTQTMERADLKSGDLARVVSTGYGRAGIDWADKTITEISCQAASCTALYPRSQTIIDIGGQDSKVVALSEQGRVRDFALNDRCAAGTGRFLEMVATIVNVPLAELGSLAAKAEQSVEINSTCAVFAESEIVSLLARGSQPADVVHGAIQAIARRVKSLAGKLSYQPAMVFTGGVAKNQAVVESLQKHFGCEVLVPEHPQLTGAFGAALLADYNA